MGKPVVMVSVLDWLLIVGSLRTFATTQTGVGIVPEESVVVTSPLASDVADKADNVNKSGELGGTVVKSTSIPCLPILLLSTTLNFTIELVGNNAVLAVEVPMMEGVADTNCILLGAVGATVISMKAVAPVTDAVILSVPELQLLSLYVEVAVPAIVVTGLESVALPWFTQEEVKTTEIGTVAGEPFIQTTAVTRLLA